MKLNKKGFTLIELMGVITILGILSLIGITGINRIVENSRKKIYADTAISYIKSVRSEITSDVAGDRFGIDSTDTTYYIHYNNIDMESKKESPWSSFVDAYVVVIKTGNDKNPYEYAWTSKDHTGWMIPLTTENDLKGSAVKLDNSATIDTTTPYKGRNKIVVFDKNGHRNVIS